MSCAPGRFLDLLLGKDSRPRQDGTAAPAAGDSAGGTAQQPPGAGPASSTGGGFAGRVTLTVPLGTAAGLADRPGELGGLGPVDPWLARDLVAAAAASPKTTWCVTVTDQHGHAVGARLRPARTQEPRANAPDLGRRADRVLLHPGQPGRAARRIRHLAAAHPGRRAGPDRHDRPAHHRPVRPPVRGPRPRPRGQAPAPVPDPARHLHQPRLPAARRPVRLRAQHPVRGRRPDVPVQRAARSAGMTIGSSSTPGGRWTSCPTGSVVHIALRFRGWMV